jgi:hypothetical protein
MLVLRWQTLSLSGLSYSRPLPCSNCREPRRVNIALNYSWCGIFMVCGIVYQQRQILTCATCGRELKPPPRDAARQAARHIPWYQRHGLMAMVTVILVLGVMMSMMPT